MVEFLHDLRFGLRVLARSPVFTATAALLLAIGISANTLIFSAVDALLLRRLPVTNPQELVRLIEVHPTGFQTWDFPPGVCEALAERSTSLSEVLCEGTADVALTGQGHTERLRVHFVSPNYFFSLGVGAAIGRVLAADDARAETTPVVLSHNFWRRRFGADPAVVGRSITLNGHACTVVGVLPQRFNGLTVDTSPAIRLPAGTEWNVLPKPDDRAMWAGVMVRIFGRVPAGVGIERAEAEVEPMARSAYEDLAARERPEDAEDYRRSFRERRFPLQPIEHGVSTLREQFQPGLLALMAGVALLLLMACTNVAGLLLARAAARTHEMGVRLVLGASRWRVARQLLTESLPLAALGGIAGVLLTYACLPLLVGALPPIRDRAAVLQPLSVHIDVDVRVLSFAILATLLTALLFGLSPAVAAARTSLAGALRSERSGTARMFPRNLMVVVQVAVCTLLLVGAALLVETLKEMRAMDAGFDRDRVVTFTVDPRMKAYEPEQAAALSRDLLERARALPGVTATGLASLALMRGTGMKFTIAPAGVTIETSDFLNASSNGVTPGYLETMGIELATGRDFTSFDRGDQKPRKVIVNQELVRRFFPGEDPIGKLLGNGSAGSVAPPQMEIIGVVNDAKYRSLREEIHPNVFGTFTSDFEYGFVLHVRAEGRPESLIAPVREALRSLDPELPFVEIHTLDDEVEATLWQERLLAGLSSIFAAIAALLAGIGLYGALDYAVKARTREIGVRAALGAGPTRIFRLLAGHTMALVLVGIALGLAAHAALAGWLRQVLFAVQPSNPAAISAALLVIAAAVLLATAPPIWRAVRIDPASALRHE